MAFVRNGFRLSLMVVCAGAIIMAGCDGNRDGAVNGSPADPVSNWYRHDRTNDRAALDHGYNLLASCAPDAILFTLGDNDTYPLWYLQQVTGYRRDVTVVNVSLLNAPWYIRQLRDNPRSVLFTDMADGFIDTRLTGGMSSYSTLRWPTQPSSMTAAGIRWNMPPSWVAPDSAYGLLSVANYLTIRIIDGIEWSRPIYFTPPAIVMMNLGLDGHLVREGLVLRLAGVPNSTDSMYFDTGKVAENLYHIYRLDSIIDPLVYRPPDTMNTLDIYFELAVDLMLHLADTGDREQARNAAMLARKLAANNPEHMAGLADKAAAAGIEFHLPENNGGTSP